MTLRLRRGTDTERLSIVPAEGELLYTTDTKEIYVGDGSTLGGLRVTGAVTNSPPTLTQNLDLNNFTISGTGTINVNGNVTGQDVIANNNILAGGTIQGTQFIGDGSLLTGVSSSGIVEGNNYRINIVANDSTVMLDTVSQNIIGNFFGDASNVTGITLNQLDDVNVINPPDGSVLVYNAGLSEWTFGEGGAAGLLEGQFYKIGIAGDDSSILVDNVNSRLTGDLFYNVNGNISANGDINITTSSGRVAINGHEFFGSTGILQPNFDGGANIGSPFARYLTGHFIDLYALRINGDGSGITNIPPSALDPNQIYEISIQGDILGPDSTPAYNFGANLFKGDFEGEFVGSLFGDVQGDIIGSVFAADSTTLVDADNSAITSSLYYPSTGSAEFSNALTNNRLEVVFASNDARPKVYLRSVLPGTQISRNDPSEEWGGLYFEVSDDDGITTTIAINGGPNHLSIGHSSSQSFSSDIFTYFSDGNVGIGIQPTEKFEVNGNASILGYIRVGSLTNLEIDGLGDDSTDITGTFVYNSSIDRFEFFQAGSWVPLPNNGTSAGQVLTWDGTKWEGTAPATGGSVVSADQLDGFDGPYYLDWSNFTNTPTTLAGYGIIDAFDGDFDSLTNTPTTLSGYGITDAVATTDLGSFTFTGSVLDTTDSSAITVTPAITFSSDVIVQNDLVVTNKIIAETIEVQNIITNASGTPEIASDTDIILSAGTRVEVASSPFKLASFTTAERDALSAQNGDMIYNTDANKFQGYAGGVWVNLH